MSALERFDELVSNYLDEALDEEGMAELNTLLATRPDYASRFVKLSRLHGGLRELEAPGGAAVRPPRRIFFWVSSAAAAALVLGFGLSVLRPARERRSALFIVGQADPLVAGDQAVRARLEGRGFAVETVAEAQARPEQSVGKAFVLISGSTRSSEMGGRFAKVAVPILNCEPTLNGALRLSGPPAPNRSYSKHGPRTLRILDPIHPLAGGLQGTVQVYGPGDAWMGWGEPGPAAIRVAAIEGSDRESCLFGVEAGARRVFFFLPNVAQEATRLTADGWKLFDAAVDWLTAK